MCASLIPANETLCREKRESNSERKPSPPPCSPDSETWEDVRPLGELIREESRSRKRECVSLRAEAAVQFLQHPCASTGMCEGVLA